MEKDTQRLSKRSIAIWLMTIPLQWLIVSLLVSFIFPAESWPPSLPISVTILIVPIILIGFAVYAMNYRDERTSLVSDKATRNGFAFVIYVIPLALVVLSLTGAPLETGIVLVAMWIGAVAVFSISALYYYHK